MGFGRIGQRVAKMLTTFGSKIVICDPKTSSKEFVNVSLEELCEISDVVTLHIPYDKSTHHMIGKKQFDLMRTGSLFVNISRGGLVDEDALLNALQSGQIAGAALDCFEQEPYSGPLSKLENVQMTAHMGTYARETRDRMEQEASRLLVDALRKMKVIK